MVRIINFILKIVYTNCSLNMNIQVPKEDTAVPMYNFINSLFRINLAMLEKFAIHYGLKAT